MQFAQRHCVAITLDYPDGGDEGLVELSEKYGKLPKTHFAVDVSEDYVTLFYARPESALTEEEMDDYSNFELCLAPGVVIKNCDEKVSFGIMDPTGREAFVETMSDLPDAWWQMLIEQWRDAVVQHEKRIKAKGGRTA